jgi:hypothetical protein
MPLEKVLVDPMLRDRFCALRVFQLSGIDRPWWQDQVCRPGEQASAERRLSDWAPGSTRSGDIQSSEFELG